MSFRTKVFVTFLPLALLPLVAFAYLVRNEVSERLTRQFENQVATVTTSVTDELGSQSHRVGEALAGIRKQLQDDNRFRTSLVSAKPEDRQYIVDYASGSMSFAGLGVLQLQNEKGRILSSGHFRGEFDRVDIELPLLLASLGERAGLSAVQTPTQSHLALLRVDSVQIGGSKYFIVGGSVIGAPFVERLSSDNDLDVRIVYPGGIISKQTVADSVDLRIGAFGRRVELPFVVASANVVKPALLVVDHGTNELEQLQTSMDRWLALAVLLSILLVGIGVAILAARISRPLAELAEKTSRINLDKLNVDFHTRRRDEIGHLSNVLGKMTRKLKTRAGEIRDAERRATQGELARQVNHDIKNGLTPIRNVFAHLIELSDSAPDQVSEVLKQRSNTIESSLSYLATLSANYAKLSPESIAIPCDLARIVTEVVADFATHPKIEIRKRIPSNLIFKADPVAVRRIIENLVDNAVDSITGSGSVAVEAELVEEEAVGKLIRLVISDTGSGMDDAQKARVFEDFYTTKKQGTGLGLSIVRRLVMDLGGRIAVESEVGKGTRFLVEFSGLDDPTAATS